MVIAPNPLTFLLFSNLSTGSKLVNILNFFLLHTYKVLTHATYLKNLISVQPSFTLSRPLTSSKIKKIQKPFISLRFTLPLEQTASSFVSLNFQMSHLLHHLTSFHLCHLLLFHYPSLFHSKLITYLFHKCYPPQFISEHTGPIAQISGPSLIGFIYF